MQTLVRLVNETDALGKDSRFNFGTGERTAPSPAVPAQHSSSLAVSTEWMTFNLRRTGSGANGNGGTNSQRVCS